MREERVCGNNNNPMSDQATNQNVDHSQKYYVMLSATNDDPLENNDDEDEVDRASNALATSNTISSATKDNATPENNNNTSSEANQINISLTMYPNFDGAKVNAEDDEVAIACQASAEKKLRWRDNEHRTAGLAVILLISSKLRIKTISLLRE